MRKKRKKKKFSNKNKINKIKKNLKYNKRDKFKFYRKKSLERKNSVKKNKIIHYVNNKLPVKKIPARISKKTGKSSMNGEIKINASNYFTEETERAIVEYKNSQDQSYRDKIFREKIEFPFKKLIESIFHRFKFSYFSDSPERVQQEVLSHLASNIEKYDPEISSKVFSNKKCRAFSYFSVMARNWLMSVNNFNYRNYQKNLPITEIHKDGDDENIHFVQLQYTDPMYSEVEKNEFIDMLVEYLDKNKFKIFPKHRDIEILNAVLELLQKRFIIEETNKKALYIYIKNMVSFGCKTQHITKVLNKIQKYYSIVKKNYLSNGKMDDIILI